MIEQSGHEHMKIRQHIAYPLRLPGEHCYWWEGTWEANCKGAVPFRYSYNQIRCPPMQNLYQIAEAY